MNNKSDQTLLNVLIDSVVKREGGQVNYDPENNIAYIELNQCQIKLNLNELNKKENIDLQKTVSEIVENAKDFWKHADTPQNRKNGLTISLANKNILKTGNFIHRPISSQTVACLAWTDPAESAVGCLSAEQFENWSIGENEAFSFAISNLNKSLKKARLEFLAVEEWTVAVINSDSPLKSSLVFAPDIHKLVESRIGWPVLAVIPSRDFVYILPADAKDLLKYLGEIVIQEFAKSAYPISTEVFYISNKGIEPHFELMPGVESEQSSAHGMKYVTYGDDLVSFRLPEHWLEEYDDMDDVVYYEDIDSLGALRVEVDIYQNDSKEELSIRSLARMLEGLDLGPVTQLASGNLLISYVKHFHEEDEEFSIYYWKVANICDKDKAAIATFSYTIETSATTKNEVQLHVEMLHEEISNCIFAKTVSVLDEST